MLSAVMVNLKAPFVLIQTVSDHIRDNGRIINVSTGLRADIADRRPTLPIRLALFRLARPAKLTRRRRAR